MFARMCVNVHQSQAVSWLRHLPFNEKEIIRSGVQVPSLSWFCIWNPSVAQLILPSSFLPNPLSFHQARWWLHATLLPSSEDQEWPQCLLKAHQQPNPRFCSGQVSSSSSSLVLSSLHTLLSWASWRLKERFLSVGFFPSKVRCIFLPPWAPDLGSPVDI